MELGNSLIRSVVRELLSEMPHMTQFASLSPIPGFRDWLISEVNSLLHQRQGKIPALLSVLDAYSHMMQ